MTPGGPAGLPSRPARATPNRWGLAEAAVGFAVGLVLSGLAASVAQQLTHYRSGHDLPLSVTVASVAGLWVGLVGAAIWAGRRRGTASLREDFGLRLRSWRDLLGGAVVGVASQYVLLSALYWPFEQFDHGLRHQLNQPAQRDTGAVHGLLAVGVLILALAVGAPVVEELFFRGLVLRGLLGVTRVPVAIVGSGLLFGLAHFEAAQFAGLAVFGMVLGLLAWRTGRLGPGIAAHAAFNASAVLSIVHLH